MSLQLKRAGSLHAKRINFDDSAACNVDLGKIYYDRT